MRPPYGFHNPTVDATVESLGYVNILWTRVRGLSPLPALPASSAVAATPTPMLSGLLRLRWRVLRGAAEPVQHRTAGRQWGYSSQP